jgi:hypothetical protein
LRKRARKIKQLKIAYNLLAELLKEIEKLKTSDIHQ